MSSFAKSTLQVVMIIVMLQFYIDHQQRFRYTAVVMAQPSTTVISDTTFFSVDWSVQVRAESGASQTSKQETSGGNPGAFRSMAYSLPRPAVGNDAEIEVAHIFEGQSYDPSVQGAIEKLDRSEDIILLNMPWPHAYLISYMILKQDDQIYRSTSYVFSRESWHTATFPSLREDAFVTLDGLENNPDFSDSGSLIKFGFWRGSIRTYDSPVPADSTIVLEHGIDNFIVTIHHAAPANRPPIAEDDDYVIASHDETINLTLAVTNNDYDPDGDYLTLSEIIPPPGREARFYQQTGISYDYRVDESDWVTMFYTVTDGEFFDDAEVTLIKDCACFTACAEIALGTSTRKTAREDTVDLDLLYQLRDELLNLTEHGARYVDIYYNSTPELLKVLLIDRPELGARAVVMVEMLQPALRSLLQGDGTVQAS